jgi:hypothetical protein
MGCGYYSHTLLHFGNASDSYAITITPADLGKYIMIIGFGALVIGISLGLSHRGTSL